MVIIRRESIIGRQPNCQFKVFGMYHFISTNIFVTIKDSD
jgi:hypothetical protein